MASPPPKIDRRTYETIVEQTQNLAEQFSGWDSATNSPNDLGRALIRIFGRMAKLVSDRLNQVPDKNFLAFLELLGAQLSPPLPAKVPLTFYLSEGSPVDGLVPAYTQVSAPPQAGENEEIVFETDQELVVTTAQLKAVYVCDPIRDTYSDRTDAAIGIADQAFPAFDGEHPIEHLLFIECDEVFSLPELGGLKLVITTPNISQFQALSLSWFAWDNSQWQPLSDSPIPNVQVNPIIFEFNHDLPSLFPKEIQGKTAKWLQARLTNLASLSLDLPLINKIEAEIEINTGELIPDICLYNSSPLDLSKDFYPFGEQSQENDTFYIALHDTYVKPGTVVTIDIQLKQQLPNDSNLTIVWEIADHAIWQGIPSQNNPINWTEGTSAIQFTGGTNLQAKLKFPDSDPMPLPSTVAGESRFWIRARIIKGHFGQPSQERKYNIYSEVAIISDVPNNTNTIKIVGNATDFLKADDVIKIAWIDDSNREQQSEYKIKLIKDNALELETMSKVPKVGAKIFRRDIITETIPPTYDPPVIQSLKLSYNVTLTQNATYCSQNNFIYSQPIIGSDFRPFVPAIDQFLTLYLGFDQSFDNKSVMLFIQIELPLPEELSTTITTETVLTEAGVVNANNLKVQDATGWREGDRIAIPSPSEAGSLDSYILTEIKKSNSDPPVWELTIHDSLKQNYSQPTQVIYPTQPKLIWEYFSDQGWKILGVTDETQAFSRSGLIQFIAPIDSLKSINFEQDLYWLRVRHQDGNFRVKPRLRRILTNTIWASQAISSLQEILGASNAEPNQLFVTRNIPVLAGQKLEVQEGQIPLNLDPDRFNVVSNELGEVQSVWVSWQEVPNFYSSSSGDRHYLIDRLRGEIRFGDGQAGMIPPRGINNIRLSFYRTGGGKQGNLAAQRINQLKTTLPYIDRGINLIAAEGGADQEDLERLKNRVPKQLRHRNRAVTQQDIEDLAYEASTDVARVKLITPDLSTPNFYPLDENLWLNSPQASGNSHRPKVEFAGQTRLIVLPNSQARQPTPTLGLLAVVESYIRARCEPTLDLVVSGPRWHEVTVTAIIMPISLQGVDILRNTVSQKLEAFLHCLTGGRGKGWTFGRLPHLSDIYATIQSVAGVDYIDTLKIYIDSVEIDSVEFLADSLIYSGQHTITIADRGGQSS